jgi:hypothetical protein
LLSFVMSGLAMLVDRAERLRLLRAERVWDRGKVRREVFAMHAKGGPCWVGRCCQGMRIRIGEMRVSGSALF